MNTIQVHSLSFMEVIMGFAKSFKTHYSEHCGEYFLEIPNTWGKGMIKGVNFEGGLGIIHYVCTFHEDLEIQFIADKIHPLKYLYCLEGSFSHRFSNHKSEHVLEQFQSAIIASEKRNGHILNFSKNQFTDIYSLEIDRKEFKSKRLSEINLSKPKLHNLLNDDRAIDQFYYKGLYSLILAMLFQEIKVFEHDGLIKKLFLEGKAYQILSDQLIQYVDDEKSELEQMMLKKSEVKSILEAITIIEEDLHALGTIQSIADRVGLNRNKIQDGFKSLYGLTVNAYIQKTRLEVAKNLLVETDYPVQEIMEKVGWNNKSYFSKLFKETFLYSPSDFRKRHFKN